MTRLKFATTRKYPSAMIKIHEIFIVYLDHINHSDVVKNIT